MSNPAILDGLATGSVPGAGLTGLSIGLVAAGSFGGICGARLRSAGGPMADRLFADRAARVFTLAGRAFWMEPRALGTLIACSGIWGSMDSNRPGMGVSTVAEEDPTGAD